MAFFVIQKWHKTHPKRWTLAVGCSRVGAVLPWINSQLLSKGLQGAQLIRIGTRGATDTYVRHCYHHKSVKKVSCWKTISSEAITSETTIIQLNQHSMTWCDIKWYLTYRLQLTNIMLLSLSHSPVESAWHHPPSWITRTSTITRWWQIHIF